jgi:F-type H+-transporting ATPase subunit b
MAAPGIGAQIPAGEDAIMRFRISMWLPALAALFLACAISPQPLWAAEGGGERWGALFLIGRLFNLGLVVFVLVWIARKPLAEFYASRSQSIREQLAEAQRAREDAEARLAAVEARMSRLNEELAEMKAAAQREAEEEYRRLIAEAERDADKIVERSRQEIDVLTRAAHLELKRHAADLTVRLAEDRIRAEIDDADRERLVGRFVDQLGGNR